MFGCCTCPLLYAVECCTHTAQVAAYFTILSSWGHYPCPRCLQSIPNIDALRTVTKHHDIYGAKQTLLYRYVWCVCGLHRPNTCTLLQSLFTSGYCTFQALWIVDCILANMGPRRYVIENSRLGGYWLLWTLPYRQSVQKLSFCAQQCPATCA